MWIDDEDVLHTVALPIPTDVMSVEFRRGLDSLIASGREPLRDVVEDVQTRLLEMDWSLMNRSEFYVETSPQRELLHVAVKPQTTSPMQSKASTSGGAWT